MLAHSGPPWAKRLAPYILPCGVFGRTGFTAGERAVTSSGSGSAPKRDESMTTMGLLGQDSRDQRIFERTVLAAEASVGLLRGYAETALMKWDLVPRTDDVRVVVSELATNAVRARSGQHDRRIT